MYFLPLVVIHAHIFNIKKTEMLRVNAFNLFSDKLNIVN